MIIQIFLDFVDHDTYLRSTATVGSYPITGLIFFEDCYPLNRPVIITIIGRPDIFSRKKRFFSSATDFCTYAAIFFLYAVGQVSPRPDIDTSFVKSRGDLTYDLSGIRRLTMTADQYPGPIAVTASRDSRPARPRK